VHAVVGGGKRQQPPAARRRKRVSACTDLTQHDGDGPGLPARVVGEVGQQPVEVRHAEETDVLDELVQLPSRGGVVGGVPVPIQVDAIPAVRGDVLRQDAQQRALVTGRMRPTASQLVGECLVEQGGDRAGGLGHRLQQKVGRR
jgi:hypothetical protein